MQMEHDFDEGRFGSARMGDGLFPAALPWGSHEAGREAGSGLAHPDWSAIRARFAALHALRRTLDESSEAWIPAGGFHEAGSAVLRSCRETGRGVNLFCSANGKVAAPIITAVAVSPTNGDRGLQ